MRYHDFGGPELLLEDEVPTPAPGEHEVLIEVAASSVNPADWKLGEGWTKGWLDVPMPFTPGIDVSGVVREVGANVTAFKPGDRVYGMERLDRCGGFAEFVTVSTTWLATAPRSIPLTITAAVPLAAITAWTATLGEDQADVQAGQRVLIHGGAGGTGIFAVQLARWRGAHVIATASASNHDLLQDIGANEAIDYRSTRFEDVVRDLDVVIDLVGGDLALRSLPVLRKGGVFATIVPPTPDEAAQLYERAAQLSVRAVPAAQQRHGTLDQVSLLIDSGVLRVAVSQKVPLAEAGKALQQNKEGHARGKVVVSVGGDK